MLKSKCILAEKEETDGKRISVMSRHTLDDGITPDERITQEVFDEHNSQLGPPSKLVGIYYKNKITFDQYKESYLDYLTTIKEKIIEILIQPSLTSNITVMCIEETPESCHRKILIEYSKFLGETLGMNIQIDIK